MIPAFVAIAVTLASLSGAPASQVQTDATDPRGVDASRTDAEARVQAQQAFADGERAWAKGDYATAARHFARAQRLVPHPFTLYNLGQAQQRAGDPVAAWHTFTALAELATDTPQRNEAIAARARLKAEVAQIEIRVGPSHTVTLDAEPIRSGERRVVAPGRHEVAIDGRVLPIDIAGGELRTLQRVGDEPRPAPSRAVSRGLLGATVLGAATATGLGSAAAIVDEGATRRGLTIGAAIAAGAATATAIATLVTMRRRADARRPNNGERRVRSGR